MDWRPGPSVNDYSSAERSLTRVRHEAPTRPPEGPSRLCRVSAETRVRESSGGGAVGAQRPGRAGEPKARPAAAAPGAKRGTWHYAKHVSAELHDEADQRQTRRHVRYAQLQVLWTHSEIERVRKCRRVTHSGTGHVVIRNNSGVAHYAGLTTCGSIWACPVCSAQVRNHRAEEISEATARWDRAGNSVYMATFTAPHDLGDRLKPLLSTIADGFRSVIAGRTWTKMKKALGIVGTIRSMEVTHGKSGWHPHLHVLIYVEGDMGAAGLASLVGYLQSKWRNFIVSQGFRPPTDRHGVDVQRCISAEEAGLYIAKTQDGRSVGNEMARADMKQGRKASRTPFEILDDFRWTGDCADVDLWHEYETATKGRQCITWSKALRQILRAAEEQSDEEVAAAEIGGEDLAVIPGETWKAITVVPGLPAALLDAVERGGLAEGNVLLCRHGVGVMSAPPHIGAACERLEIVKGTGA